MKSLIRTNRTLANQMWRGELSGTQLKMLDFLSQQHGFSLVVGDLQLLDDKWYVTNSGLLRLASRSNCAGISAEQVREFCDFAASRWVFKAIVYKTFRSKGFVGYGDADPSNVSSMVHGAEMRVAETRAVNRALRKAYGIGLCSVEEVACLSSSTDPRTGTGADHLHSNGNASSNGHSRLRDRLCLLIRQHQLDPSLVKRYATDFCRTLELREASRDSVDSFITHLAEWAAKDRAGLLCKLNSYSQPQEVQR
jgi:hypothetical protein